MDFNAAEGVYVNLAEPAEGDRVRASPYLNERFLILASDS